MIPTTAPLIPIPEPLRGSEYGSFAERTLSVRIPNIGRRVLEDRDWQSDTIVALEDLIDSLPHDAIRLLQDRGAPDMADWTRYSTPFVGQTWLQVPWFFAESYFFRRILEATGYFQSGSGFSVDPYAFLKSQEMAATPESLQSLCAQLDQLYDLSKASRKQTRNALAQLMRIAIWGNQADLSMWWSPDQEHPPRLSANQLEEHLLDDDAAEASDYLASLENQPVRVDFIMDNGGSELANDLALVDFLFRTGQAHSIWFHVKPYPTYVSDVTIHDVLETVNYLAAAGDSCVRNLANRIQGYLSDLRLRMKQDYFWTSPLSGWEMPAALRRDLSQSNLIISKGDANYRRWLGDRRWPFTTPLEQVLSYLPAPLLALRVLKSEVAIGLQPGQPEKLYQIDPHWLFDGKYGVIQFIVLHDYKF